MADKKKPELLSPAGDTERLLMAVNYGADAVYMAGKQFGMRGGVENFTTGEMGRAVKYCHERGVKAHITVNTLPRADELKALPGYLEELDDMGADALIIADLGVFRMAQKYAPDTEKHISTQSGIVNSETARAWYDLGAKRVVLAREMTFPEIIELRQNTPPELEIETFIHGAMCVSFSGRCLLSDYMTGRDANRGQCAQPCRWKYYLMEEKRPGELFPITEDEKGTYIMNSRDMCMIDHVPELIDAGIDAFKIEGRAKSSYYAAAVTNAYRHAVDCAMQGLPLPDVWRSEVEKISHRNYCTGFYYGRPENGQFYEDARYIRDWQISAVVEECDGSGSARLTQRNRFNTGDNLELIAPGIEPVAFTAGQMRDSEGRVIDCAIHPMMEFYMKLPVKVPKYAVLRREK